MSALDSYWSGISTWLMVQAGQLNRHIVHNGEKGKANELVVADFLSRLLPPNVEMSSGIIVGTDGSQSRQCDILLQDNYRQPRLFAQTTQVFHPADTTLASIEVKTTLTEDEVKAIGANTKSVRSAKSASGELSPFTAVFAFESSASVMTSQTWFDRLPVEERPNLVVIANPGFLLETVGSELVGHSYLLHAKGDGGGRTSGNWRKNARVEAVSIEGSSYPVSKAPGMSGYWVYEPGRALLAFCLNMLSALELRGAVGSPWWTHYFESSIMESVSWKTV